MVKNLLAKNVYMDFIKNLKNHVLKILNKEMLISTLIVLNTIVRENANFVIMVSILLQTKPVKTQQK